MEKLAEEIKIMTDALTKTIDNHTAEHPTGTLPASGRGQVGTALQAARSVGTIAQSAYSKLEQLRLNDTVFPEGRKRMMGELLADAEEKTAEKVDMIDVNATVARASFVVAALPKLAKNREMIAREDARMLLDQAADPGAMLAHLAQRQDDVGALVVTQWGQDYLRSRGCDDKDIELAQAEIIGMALIGAGGQSGDAERSDAARGAMAAESLLRVRDAAMQVGTGLLQSMRDYYAVPRPDFPEPRDSRRPAAPTVLGEDVGSLRF